MDSASPSTLGKAGFISTRRASSSCRARVAVQRRRALTVWAWLIGPLIDAWVKVYPDDRAAARQFLDRFEARTGEAGIGSISEVFDAEPPFTPRGCIAQAWSVAEVLRCLVKTAAAKIESMQPRDSPGRCEGPSVAKRKAGCSEPLRKAAGSLRYGSPC
jgi:glycogen debranching enzyme